MKRKKTANRRKFPWPEGKPAKSLDVGVCHVCGKFVNANDAYFRDPQGGRLSEFRWCADCYERGVTRSVNPPSSMEKVA